MRAARADRLLLAILLAWAAADAGAVELGTLFHSPEERARLDSLRRGEPVERAPVGTSGAREVTGFVKRSDGRNTVWIDGVPLPLATPKSDPLLDPRAVRGFSERRDGVKIERKPPT